jgi:hypothetical protein
MENIVRAPCQLCGVDRPLKQVTLTLVALPTNIVNDISRRRLPS